eukprot:4338288-Heterocapsa_arctica.AAC.1
MVHWDDTEWSSGGGWQHEGKDNKGKYKGISWQPVGQRQGPGATAKGTRAFTLCLACGSWVYDDKLVDVQG